jgi:hypothetical protein
MPPLSRIRAKILVLLLVLLPLTVRANDLPPPPYVGAIVHTMYLPDTEGHWNIYRKSASYWETGRKPLLGFYEQTTGTTIQASHYRQMREAKCDYALFSWYGGSNGPVSGSALDQVMDSYWKVFFSENAKTKAAPIRLAILMEFSARPNFRERIDFLKAEYYDRYPQDVLTYQGRPMLGLGMDHPLDPPGSEQAVIDYAESRGFYVVAGNSGKTGGAAFVGIGRGWGSQPPQPVPLYAKVSPAIDVSGKHTWIEAEKLPIGCGKVVPDPAASQGLAVESTGTRGDLVSTVVNPPGIGQYGEWTAIFRLKTDDVASVHGLVSIKTQDGTVSSAPINAGSFQGNGRYAHVPVLFRRRPNTPIDVRVQVDAGRLWADCLWITHAPFWKPSLEAYDSQWQEIEEVPPAQRPRFISIASLNCWEEGTSIEASTVNGSSFLDRTAYWSERLKREAQAAGVK